MIKLLKILCAILLFFNGIGAIYGGWNLIIHPDGSSIQLSMSWLEHTPFQDYLIPGIILFIANGILSFFTLIALIFNFRNFPFYVIGQGIILSIWIIIQIVLIRTVYFLHLIMGSVGLLLIIFGWILHRQTFKKK